MTDLNTLSDEQLLAIASGQAPPDVGFGAGVRPPDASTGQGVDLWVGSDQMVPASAPDGPTQQGGFEPPATPAPAPTAPPPEQGLAGATQDRFAAFARGVPVLGSLADEGSAAVNAAVAPAVEPVLKWLDQKGIDLGFDERYQLGDIPGFGARYDAAKQMQNSLQQRYDAEHPVQSGMLQFGGGIASGVGAAALAPRALAPLSTALKPGAGLVARSAAAAGEGAALGAAHGYGMGEGGLDDPSRANSALVGGAVGGGIGAIAPGAMDLIGAGARAAVRPFLQRGRRVPEGAMAGAPEAAAPGSPLPATAPTPAVPAVPQDDLAAVLAARQQIPMPRVKAGAEEDAYAHIARALERQRQTPQLMADSVTELGPLGVIADSGPAMADLGRQAINRPSGAETIAREALDARQTGVMRDGEWVSPPSSTRLLNEAQGGLQVPDTKFHQSFDVLSQIQKEAADPLYAQVREIGPTNSPKLDRLMARPSMQRARRQAYELAKEEGRDPEGLGLTFMDEPDWNVSTVQPEEQPTVRQSLEKALRGRKTAPTQGKSLAKFIADGGGLRDAGGELSAMDAQLWNHGKAFQRRIIGDGDSDDGWAMRAWEAGYFPELVERPTPRQLYDALDAEFRGKPRYAREADQGAADRYRMREEAEEMLYRGGSPDDVPNPDDYVGRPAPENGPVWTTEPTAETWDYIKRGLDDQLEPYREGKKAWDSKARAINQTLQDLKAELIELNPVYGEALSAYAGPAAMKDALSAGRRAFSEDAEMLGRKFADMGQAEQDMYRLGALQALKDKLGGSDVTANAARIAGLLRPNQLERFREIFPSQETYARFVQSMQNENRMFGTRSAAFGNSTTAKQLAGMQQEEPGALEQGVGLALSAKTGGVAGLLGAINRVGQPRMSAETAEAIAAILMNTDQSQLPQVIERLLGARARQQASEIGAQVARAQAATQGGSAMGRE